MPQARDFVAEYNAGTPYAAKFRPATRVQIAARQVLEEFMAAWTYHHKVTPDQLDFGGRVAEVESHGAYQGGAIIYELKGVPGYWHELLLSPAD